MKKLLLTILLSSLPACAFEDYMIISDCAVKFVNVENEKIISVKPVFTVDNEKRVLIVTPKTSGKTLINVVRYNDEKTIEVKVTKNMTTITPQEGFNYFLMDSPPMEASIPLPPANSILPQPPKYKGGK